ncbi:MAG: LamG domain-containing protein [Clostridia bacterium]|nr:LamG domain-containing protein [Clostridia bacterium]
MRRTKENGITLIVLVITIIVLVIIAFASISILSDNGAINQSSRAKVVSEFEDIREQVKIYRVKGEATENDRRYLNIEEAKKALKNISDTYENRIGLYREDLVYLGKEDSKYGQYAKECGYIVLDMTPEEFKYYIELGVVEDRIREIKEYKKDQVGRTLGTNSAPEEIQIGENEYDYQWCIIGNYTDGEKANNTYSSQFEDLELKDITHAPYLVNYRNGKVLSIDGMIMYDERVLVHSFSNMASILSKALTYVDEDTKKTGEYFGNLYTSSMYTGEIQENSEAKYDDNGGLLQYDNDGALVLDKDNAIPVIEVKEKYEINEGYSVSCTVNGDVEQHGEGELGSSYKFPRTILALSDVDGSYISWIGYFHGYLHVYSFKKGSCESVNYEYEEQGFASIDIKKYQGQTINIQVVAKRGGKTKVYINGELIKVFASGSEKFEYKYATIGDLRMGRNLKFIGKIYNLAIYGEALEEDEVQEIWNYVKDFLEKRKEKSHSL